MLSHSHPGAGGTKVLVTLLIVGNVTQTSVQSPAITSFYQPMRFTGATDHGTLKTRQALASPTVLFKSVWRSIEATPNAIRGWWSHL